MSPVAGGPAGAASGGGEEREVKLGAPPGFELPDLTGAAPGLAVVAAEDQVLDATYYDTPDLRLARRGVTLRHRVGEGAARWTLKLAAGGTGGALAASGALRRREIDVADGDLPSPADVADGDLPSPADGDPLPGPGAAAGDLAPPAALAALVCAYVRTETLVPVARLRSRRRRAALVAGDGSAIGEVDDDEVEVIADGEVTARFREVEVELAPGAPDAALAPVVTVLRAAGAGAPDPQPKLVRALGPRALAPSELPPIELGPDATVAQLIQAALGEATRALLDHDHVMRLDDDVEGVHQARVAVRRLRAGARTLAPMLDAGWASAIGVELGWVADALGGPRDADVVVASLQRAGRALSAADREAFEVVLGRAAADRRACQGALLVVLGSSRYITLLDRLVGGISEPPVLADTPARAADALPAVAARPWRRLRRGVASVGDDPTDAELHSVRVLVKRARDAIALAAPVVPEAGGLVDALGQLQGVLGALSDASATEAWLRRRVSHGAASTEAFVAGQLTAVVRADADGPRAAWRAAWEQADRRKLTGWLG